MNNDNSSVSRISKDLDSQIIKLSNILGISKIEASKKIASEFKKKNSYEELFNL
jgi:hypothetical protein